MKYFIVDDSYKIKKSVDTFLDDLQSDNNYFKVYRYNGFYDFFLNFIKAVINDKDVVLIDTDFTENEIEHFGFKDEIGMSEKILNPVVLVSLDELVKRIRNSQSDITFFTSGTTGQPKLVHHSIISLTRLVKQDEKHGADVWGLAYNPTHMAGIQVMLQALFNANTMIYVFDKSINEISENIKKYNITHISATPTFYRLLVSLKKRFDSVKRVTLGGEKSDNRLYTNLKSVFPNAGINNIYASTELGALFVSHNDVFSVPDTISNKVRVTNEELEVHSDLVPHLKKFDWYSTGDIVDVIREHPLLFRFKNRKTEMINIGGYKVNPYEVEEIVREFVEIENVRVFGRTNSVLGSILCLEFKRKDGQIIDAKVIKERLAKQLQVFKIPRIIKEVEVMKKTRTGKISRV